MSTGGMQHWLAVTVVAVLALVTGGVYLSTMSRDTDDVAVAAYTPPPATTPSPSATPEANPVAAFLGDSFAPAMGQPIADYNYAAILSKRLGWEPVAFGQGGTGYTNPGQADEGDSIFADRVDAIVAASPSVVIVQGSTNDRNYDRTLAAATEVFSRLRGALPDAKIIAVGPLLTPTLGAEAVTPARNAVRDAASKTSVPFIDPLEDKWLSQDRSLFVDDGVHPSGTGQAEIAAQLAKAVQPLLAS
jgi:lysophospholipase L1-like esterase